MRGAPERDGGSAPSRVRLADRTRQPASSNPATQWRPRREGHGSGRTHHGAVVDALGRPLGDREFATTPAGYQALLIWLRSHGELERAGIEGTGAYGAALARHLRAEGVALIEVDRPSRSTSPRQRQIRSARRLRRRPGSVIRCRLRYAEDPRRTSGRRSARCDWPGAARSRPAPRR